MSTTVTYKNETLTTATNQTKVLQTSGKYMEDDVTIVDVTSAQNPQEKSVAITSAGTEVVTPDVGYDALSKVTITTPSASIYGGLDVACVPSITVDDSGVVDVEVFATPSTAFCYNSGWVETSDTVTVVIRGSSTYQLTVGDNLEYGLTDGTLPLVGVAKAGYAEL